jgi:hypothetical protein
MEFVYAAIGLTVFIGLYLWSYRLNEKCEKPEGTEDLECKSCHAQNCSARKNEIEQ